MAEFLAGPRCGKRIDEIGGEEKPLSGVTKRLEASAQWAQDVVVVYCPHCGAVLGVLPPPS